MSKGGPLVLTKDGIKRKEPGWTPGKERARQASVQITQAKESEWWPLNDPMTVSWSQLRIALGQTHHLRVESGTMTKQEDEAPPSPRRGWATVRRLDSKRKEPFYLAGASRTKKKAKALAVGLRGRGFNARVVTLPGYPFSSRVRVRPQPGVGVRSTKGIGASGPLRQHVNYGIYIRPEKGRPHVPFYGSLGSKDREAVDALIRKGMSEADAITQHKRLGAFPLREEESVNIVLKELRKASPSWRRGNYPLSKNNLQADTWRSVYQFYPVYERDEEESEEYSIERAFKEGFDLHPKDAPDPALGQFQRPSIPIKVCTSIEGVESCETFAGPGELMRAAFDVGFGIKGSILPTVQDVREAMLPSLVTESHHDESTDIEKAITLETAFQKALGTAIEKVDATSICYCGATDSPDEHGSWSCRCTLLTPSGEYVEFGDVVDDIKARIFEQSGLQVHDTGDLPFSEFDWSAAGYKGPLAKPYTEEDAWKFKHTLDMPRALHHDRDQLALDEQVESAMATTEAHLAEMVALRAGLNEAGFTATPRQLLDTFEDAAYAVRMVYHHSSGLGYPDEPGVEWRAGEAFPSSLASMGREPSELGARWSFTDVGDYHGNIDQSDLQDIPEHRIGQPHRSEEDDGVLYDYTWYNNLRDAQIEAYEMIQSERGGDPGHGSSTRSDFTIEILRAPRMLDPNHGDMGPLGDRAVKYGELTITDGVVKWEVFLENLVDDDPAPVRSARALLDDIDAMEHMTEEEIAAMGEHYEQLPNPYLGESAVVRDDAWIADNVMEEMEMDQFPPPPERRPNLPGDHPTDLHVDPHNPRRLIDGSPNPHYMGGGD